MVSTANDLTDNEPSATDFENFSTDVPETSTATHSGETSPTREFTDEPIAAASQKKKKKKKSKKSAKVKAAAAAELAKAAQDLDERPPVLCISRNKHWRYISSYHGPWLQLPLELLESLLTLNLDTATLSTTDARFPLLPPPPTSISSSKKRERRYPSFIEHSPPDSPRNNLSTLPIPKPKPGKPVPPPIDPGVFRSVTSIRRLIDEAAELSVRAASGMSSTELASTRGGSGLSGGSWNSAQSSGQHGSNGGGRSAAMSAMRIHRLRALAVQKLAEAYKADEIASSVMVMQGGSLFEDIAERVLKHDPTNLHAKYVQFFHEKIPSRQLAESTNTRLLDELIAAEPQHLEYYRTRGMVHCFRDEYSQATKDFTYALKEARAVRRAKMNHHNLNKPGEPRLTKNGKRRMGNTNGQAPLDGTSVPGTDAAEDGEPPLLHHSTLPDAPDPIEPQLLFLRGTAYLQHAISLIENAILGLEGVSKAPSLDGAELRLCHMEDGKYGGVEIGNPDGPLGKKDGAKVQAYREVLAAEPFREQIFALLKKSIRDHQKFLSHFDTLESSHELRGEGDIAHQVEHAFFLFESVRPSGYTDTPPLPVLDLPTAFTTYHPLLIESYSSVLICQLMLADFVTLLSNLIRTAEIVDGLEGYPVFLAPRSVGHAELIEILERLAGGWKHGVQPHQLSVQRGKGRPMMIEAAPPPPAPSTHTAAPPSALLTLPPTTYTADESTSASAFSSASTSRKNSWSAGECSSSTPRLEDFAPSSRMPNVPNATSVAGSSSSAACYSGKKTFEGAWSSNSDSDGARALDCVRILLVPVAKRQKERLDKAAAEKAKAKKKPTTAMAINIPLHGPRVEIILAWLGAVHLPELEQFV